MKIVSLGNYDNFDDTVVAYFELGEMSPEYEAIGRSIDRENYIPNCFGFCLQLDVESEEYSVVTENDKPLYYVDNNGDKHYIADSEIDESLVNEAIILLENELMLEELYDLKEIEDEGELSGVESERYLKLVNLLKERDVEIPFGIEC